MPYVPPPELASLSLAEIAELAEPKAFARLLNNAEEKNQVNL